MNVLTKTIVENILGTKINDLSLYQRAFTHKSKVKEDPSQKSFETLEFIGDSVLGFIVTKFLFDRFEDRQEGFLTKARTKLVRHETLSQISKKLGLYRFVQMDAKGMANGWFMNPKILEAVFEALVGALYLDLGLLHAKEFVLRVYNNPQLVNLSIIYNDDNWKDHLMKYCQTNNFELPDYRMQSHFDGDFHIEAYVQGTRVGSGYAKSKKQAEQNAAKAFFYPHGGLKMTHENVV